MPFLCSPPTTRLILLIDGHIGQVARGFHSRDTLHCPVLFVQLGRVLAFVHTEREGNELRVAVKACY